MVFFAQGKFYPLFSFLFGMGFAVQMLRAEKRNVSFVWFFLRRMTALLLIGAAMNVLLENRDILMRYAVFGVPLLLFRRALDARRCGSPRSSSFWPRRCTRTSTSLLSSGTLRTDASGRSARRGRPGIPRAGRRGRLRGARAVPMAGVDGLLPAEVPELGSVESARHLSAGPLRGPSPPAPGSAAGLPGEGVSMVPRDRNPRRNPGARALSVVSRVSAARRQPAGARPDGGGGRGALPRVRDGRSSGCWPGRGCAASGGRWRRLAAWP